MEHHDTTLNRRNRVPLPVMVAFISFAFLIDLSQGVMGLLAFIPLIGIPISTTAGFLVSVIAGIFIFLSFALLGVPVFGALRGGKRMLLTVATTFVEYIPIPFVNWIPMWTIYVFLTCRDARKEDAEYNIQEHRSGFGVKSLRYFLKKVAKKVSRYYV